MLDGKLIRTVSSVLKNGEIRSSRTLGYLLTGCYVLIQDDLAIHRYSHGRDNKLCVWGRVVEAPESTTLGDTAARLNLTTPQLSYALDVNALNYCRFSLLCDPAHSHEEKRAMIALPGLIDSTVVGYVPLVFIMTVVRSNVV